MRKILRKLYLKHFPLYLRRKLQLLRSDYYLKLRKDIIDFYEKKENDSEITSIINYLKKQKTTHVFPYSYKETYKPSFIEVHYDGVTKFNYVIHNSKKLYFKNYWDEKKIQEYYTSLLIEQDQKSPHKYLTDSFNIKKAKTVFDLGCAEGIFSLDIIDKTEHLFIFEPDHEWVDALKITFSPWKHKITIISKFVGAITNEFGVALDSIENLNTIDFVKADIEGGEIDMLTGSLELLKQKKIKKMAICTYHKGNHYSQICNILDSNGFATHPSDGYIIYMSDRDLKPPYLRRGLVRAELKPLN